MSSESAWEKTAQVFYDLDAHRLEIMFVAVGVLALTIQLVLILWWATGGGRGNAVPDHPATPPPSDQAANTTKAKSEPDSPAKSEKWNVKDTGDEGPRRRRSTFPPGGHNGHNDSSQPQPLAAASGRGMPGSYFDNLFGDDAEPVDMEIDPAFEDIDRDNDPNHDQHHHVAHADVSMSGSSTLDTPTTTSTVQHQNDEPGDPIDPQFEDTARMYDPQWPAPATSSDKAAADPPHVDASAFDSASAESNQEKDEPEDSEDNHHTHSHHEHGAAEEKLRSMLEK